MQTFGKPTPGVNYHHRRGSYLLAERDGCFAAAKTPKGYYLIGGGMEQGESKKQCLIRECIEECGLRVKPLIELCAGEMYIDFPPPRRWYYHPIQHYFICELKDDRLEPIEKDHELVFLPFERSDELAIEVQRWAIGQYAESLKAHKTALKVK